MKKKVAVLLCVCLTSLNLCGFTYVEQENSVAIDVNATEGSISEVVDTESVETAQPLTVEEQYELNVVTLMNANRVAAGLGELTIDQDLMNVADVRANEIVISFAHTRPDGTRCFSAFPAGLMAFGENIAYGYATPEAVMQAWMQSPGHYQNIMNGNYTKVGVGCFKADNGLLYWVQCFGA